MSWELMVSHCKYKNQTCGTYMDDWNKSEERLCSACKNDKAEERKIRNMIVSEKSGRCIDCVALDNYGVTDYGRYFNEGKCRSCWEKEVAIPFSLKYQLNQNSNVYENINFIEEYNSLFPNNRGIMTKKYINWVNAKIPNKYNYFNFGNNKKIVLNSF